MKTKKLLIVFLIFSLSSCMPKYFYQVYKVNPDTGIETESDFIIYENQNCKISYNLWQENGDIGFIFYNKTDDDIYINLDESFFILNGIAHPYYQNRIFSSSSNFQLSGKSNYTYINYLSNLKTNTIGATSTSGYSVARVEQKIMTIPSKTSIEINGFTINNEPVRNCDIYRFPQKKEIKTVSYNKNNSPIKFTNRISYSFDKSSEPIQIKNNFYVSEITNYPENEMFDYKDNEFCNQKRLDKIKYITKKSPNKFYLKYTNKDPFSNLDH